MGGSKSTADIFKGWVRMFASMCLMMVLNVVFLKMLLSAMGNMPEGAGVLPWMIFVVAVARVARKIDNVIARIGLNPALTGDGLGHGGLPGMLSYMVVRSVASNIVKTAGGTAKSKTPRGKAPNPSGASYTGRSGSHNQNNSSNFSNWQNTSNTQSSGSTAASGSTAQQSQNQSEVTAGSAVTTPGTPKDPAVSAPKLGAATAAPASPFPAAGKPDTAGTLAASAKTGSAGTPAAEHQFRPDSRGAAGTGQNNAINRQAASSQTNNTRRSSVAQPGTAGGHAFHPS